MKMKAVREIRINNINILIPKELWRSYEFRKYLTTNGKMQ